MPSSREGVFLSISSREKYQQHAMTSHLRPGNGFFGLGRDKAVTSDPSIRLFLGGYYLEKIDTWIYISLVQKTEK